MKAESKFIRNQIQYVRSLLFQILLSIYTNLTYHSRLMVSWVGIFFRKPSWTLQFVLISKNCSTISQKVHWFLWPFPSLFTIYFCNWESELDCFCLWIIARLSWDSHSTINVKKPNTFTKCHNEETNLICGSILIW